MARRPSWHRPAGRHDRGPVSPLTGDGPAGLPIVTSVAGDMVEYRLQRQGHRTIVVFHGGHMRAGLALGEEVFTSAGFTVLTPSRPGYGRTPLTPATSVAQFTDTIAHLCRLQGVDKVAAVVGVSAGGRTALTMAARHPDLVERVILQSAVGFDPWPGQWTRLGGRIIFSAGVEAATWAALRTLLRLAPGTGLRLLMRELSVIPARQVVGGLSPEARAGLTELFRAMRSGRGFIADMDPVPDCAAAVTQPVLIIASRRDRSVPFTHAQSLATALPHAQLEESHADSHLIWFDADYPRTSARIGAFLTDRLDGQG
ncbi:alpha/beta fold hydrolase [Nonomuraea bangladeshensis]